ncbi:MAG: LacI family DNA-binding transcriptional regulator [Anaerolineae bacterium]
MATLKDVAQKAGVPILTAYHALSDSQPVDAPQKQRVIEVAAQLRYRLNITLRDVSALANVSVATISYVLNNSAPVSPPTRRRVLDAIDALGYRPNITARNLKTARSRMIGYAWHNVYAWRKVADGYVNALLDHFLYSVTLAAEACGYRLLIFVEPPDDPVSAYEELINTNRVDGFIISGTNQDDIRIRRLLDLRFPFSSFGRANDSWDFAYVDVDGAQGIESATSHLLAQGHHNVAILGWPEGSLSGDARMRGYGSAFAAAGKTPNKSWIVHTTNSIHHAYEETGNLLSMSEQQRPSGIVCFSDTMAVGAMRRIEDEGLRVGVDVAVTGFDDDPIASILRPALTSLQQPIDTIAAQMIDLLMAQIDGQPLPNHRIMLAPELIVRDSSRTPYRG